MLSFVCTKAYAFNCRSPSDPDIKLIKRVIGLEGDVVRCVYSSVYLEI